MKELMAIDNTVVILSNVSSMNSIKRRRRCGLKKALEGKEISCPVGTQRSKGARAVVCLAMRPVWVELNKKGLVWEEMKSESFDHMEAYRASQNLDFSKTKMSDFQGYYEEQ